LRGDSGAAFYGIENNPAHEFAKRRHKRIERLLEQKRSQLAATVKDLVGGEFFWPDTRSSPASR